MSHPLDIPRFWNKVDKTDTCWLWTGASTRGYGYIKHKGYVLRVHRVSYEIHYGPIPEGLLICHLCNFKTCVNPEHLATGTYLDNVMDINRTTYKHLGRR